MCVALSSSHCHLSCIVLMLQDGAGGLPDVPIHTVQSSVSALPVQSGRCEHVGSIQHSGGDAQHHEYQCKRVFSLSPSHTHTHTHLKMLLSLVQKSRFSLQLLASMSLHIHHARNIHFINAQYTCARGYSFGVSVC